MIIMREDYGESQTYGYHVMIILYLDQQLLVQVRENLQCKSTSSWFVEWVDQPTITLCRAVKFANVGYPKPLGKWRPDLWAEPIAKAQTETMLCVRWSSRLS